MARNVLWTIVEFFKILTFFRSTIQVIFIFCIINSSCALTLQSEQLDCAKCSKSGVALSIINELRRKPDRETYGGKINDYAESSSVHFIYRKNLELDEEIRNFHSSDYTVSLNNPRFFLYKNQNDTHICQNFESEREPELCFNHRARYFFKHVASFEFVIFQASEAIEFMENEVKSPYNSNVTSELLLMLNQRTSNRNAHIFLGTEEQLRLLFDPQVSSEETKHFFRKLRVKFGVQSYGTREKSEEKGTLFYHDSAGTLQVVKQMEGNDKSGDLDWGEEFLDELVLSWRLNNPRFLTGKHIRFGIFLARHHYMPLAGSKHGYIGLAALFIYGASEYYNFTYNITPRSLANEFVPETGKWTAYMQQLIDEEFDIHSFHAVPPRSEVNTTVCTFAYVSSIKFVTGKPPIGAKLESWRALFAPFRLDVWLLLMSTLGGLSLVFWLYNVPWYTSLVISGAPLLGQGAMIPTDKEKGHNFPDDGGNHDNEDQNRQDDVLKFMTPLNTFTSSVVTAFHEQQQQYQSQPYSSTFVPETIVPRLLALIWLLSSQVIVNYYNSDLYSFLTIPGMEHYPSTFRELSEAAKLNPKSNKHFHVNLMQMPGRPDDFLLKGTTYPMFDTKAEREERFMDGLDCVMKVVLEKRRACIGFYTILTPLVANSLIIHREIKPYAWSSNNGFASAVSASVKKNSKYEGSFTDIIGYVRDTGHIEKWKDDVKYHVEGLSIKSHSRLRKLQQQSKSKNLINPNATDSQAKDKNKNEYGNLEDTPSWKLVHEHLYKLLHHTVDSLINLKSLKSIFTGLIALEFFVGGSFFVLENYRGGGVLFRFKTLKSLALVIGKVFGVLGQIAGGLVGVGRAVKETCLFNMLGSRQHIRDPVHSF